MDDGRWTMDDGRRPAMPLPSIVHRPSSTGPALDFNHASQLWMVLGCAVALLTFLIHGVLDMFLEYSATNLLLWALIGALGSLAAIGGGVYDRPEHIS